MTAQNRRSRGESNDQVRTQLPPPVRLEDTVATTDTDPLPDPEDVREIAQHG